MACPQTVRSKQREAAHKINLQGVARLALGLHLSQQILLPLLPVLLALLLDPALLVPLLLVLVPFPLSLQARLAHFHFEVIHHLPPTHQQDTRTTSLPMRPVQAGSREEAGRQVHVPARALPARSRSAAAPPNSPPPATT